MIKLRNLTAMLNALIRNKCYILENAGIPQAGQGAGVAGKGALCIDRTNGKLYINTGTLAAPVWGLVGEQVT